MGKFPKQPRDASNLDAQNVYTNEATQDAKHDVDYVAGIDDLAVGEPRTVSPGGLDAFAPDAGEGAKDSYTPRGVWDGRAGGKVPGQVVAITERGSAPPDGLPEADMALGAIGAGLKATHYQSSLLNVAKGDSGEKAAIPSESNINSENQRVGA